MASFERHLKRKIAILQENQKCSSLQTKTANEARKGELKNIVRVGLLRIFFVITFVNFRYKLCFCNTVNIYSHANKPCCWWLWLNNTLPRCKEHRDMCWEMLSYSKQQAELCIWSSIKDKKNRSGSDCRDVTTVPAKTLLPMELKEILLWFTHFQKVCL